MLKPLIEIRYAVKTYCLQYLLFPCLIILISGCTQITKIEQLSKSQQSFNAESLFQSGTSMGLQLSDKGIQNLPHHLIEDDAPGFGYSADGSGSAETITGDVVLKKMLNLAEAPIDTAYIVAMFYPSKPAQPNSGAQLRFIVNGHTLDYTLEHFWTKVPVAPQFLIQGENSITVQARDPQTAFVTYLAVEENFAMGSDTRQSHPNRSAKSVDGGVSWDFDRLGGGDDLDGEYPIRLLLQEPIDSTYLKTKVFDLAPKAMEQGISIPASINMVRFGLYGHDDNPWVGSIVFRTGSSPFVGSSWSAWQAFDASEKLTGVARYMQIKISFSATVLQDALTRLEIVSQYRIDDLKPENTWVVKNLVNYPRIVSSFDFPMENPLHLKLRQLRMEYKLDSVVTGAVTQLDTLRALSSWVAGQWDWYLLPPDREIKEWDALDILDEGPDGEQQGGYCLHYAISFMQVVQSFGFPARVVNCNFSIWSGHEMTEVWVSDLRKWILMDANFDIYFADGDSKIPLNTLELHQRFLEHYYPGESINRDDWSRPSFVSRTEHAGKPSNVIGVVGGGAKQGTLSEYEWWKPPLDLSPYCGGFGYLNTGYFRFLPRSDYLSNPTPVPVNHGRTHWGWDGYLCWFDSQTPPSQEHKIFTNREADLYWNLNEVDFAATRLDNSKLHVDMTSNLAPQSHLELRINGIKQILNSSTSIIEVRPGTNNIEMQVRDTLGRTGKISSIEIEVWE